MANTSMSIRIDADVKNEAQELFSDLGLDMSTAINLFIRQAIREQRIPFEVKREIPNAETRAAMADAYKGKGLSRSFDSVDNLMDDLNA